MALAASFLGRLSAGLIAQYLGPILTWLCCVSISSLLCFTWIAVSSQNGLITFSVFWGFCSAGLVTLPAAVFPSLCPDPKRLGTRLGMSWGISSFATLTGGPIAGAILKHQSGATLQPRSDYLGPQLWGGVCMLVGASIVCCLWVMTMRSRKSNIFI